MKFFPSLMCADSGHFAQEIQSLEDAGADGFHIDIMDGEYVPNFALSWAEVANFRGITKLPFEAHLMVRNLEVHISFASLVGIRRVYIHTDHPDVAKALDCVRAYGMESGLAVNPETDVHSLLQFGDIFDAILMMRVRPGFAGQRPVTLSDQRLKLLHSMFPDKEIVVDGAVTADVIAEMTHNGATGFVLGTSSLFGKKRPYQAIMNDLRILSK